MSELGVTLRSWRDRLSPAVVGLPSGTSRRTRGLRREELAELAGVSVDYVVRLEQGRFATPSAQVVTALARALQLTDAERDHLHRLAGLAPPSRAEISDRVPAGLTRMVDRLGDAAVAIFAADWHLIRWNRTWAALIGDPSAIPPRLRNFAMDTFPPDVTTTGPLPPDATTTGTPPPDATATGRLPPDLTTTDTLAPDVTTTGTLPADVTTTGTLPPDATAPDATAAGTPPPDLTANGTLPPDLTTTGTLTTGAGRRRDSHRGADHGRHPDRAGGGGGPRLSQRRVISLTGGSVEAAVVSDLRRATGRFPHSRRLAALVEELSTGNARFAALWAEGAVGAHRAEHKIIDHPDGPITVDCDVVTDGDAELKIVILTAEPGSPDEARLRRLTDTVRV